MFDPFSLVAGANICGFRPKLLSLAHTLLRDSRRAPEILAANSSFPSRRERIVCRGFWRTRRRLRDAFRDAHQLRRATYSASRVLRYLHMKLDLFGVRGGESHEPHPPPFLLDFVKLSLEAGQQCAISSLYIWNVQAIVSGETQTFSARTTDDREFVIQEYNGTGGETKWSDFSSILWEVHCRS